MANVLPVIEQFTVRLFSPYCEK